MFLVTTYIDSSKGITAECSSFDNLFYATIHFLDVIKKEMQYDVPDSFMEKYQSFINQNETGFDLKDDSARMILSGVDNKFIFSFTDGDSFYFACKIFHTDFDKHFDLHY